MQGKLLDPITGEWSWARSSTDGVQQVSIEGAVATTLDGPVDVNVLTAPPVTGAVTVLAAPPITGAVTVLPSASGTGGVSNSRSTSVGVYSAAGPQINASASADGANVGRQWLVNPVGSGRYLAVKRLHIGAGLTGALAVALAASPQMQITRFSFTGTPSGAIAPAAKRATADATPVGSLRTAVTGMTVTAIAPIYTYNHAQLITAIGAYLPPIAVLDYRIEDQIILAPGEGLMVRQASAGAVGEARFLQVDWSWEEFV